LLASIVQRGIGEPLAGVDAAEGRFLLDGFKRYRCARKLGLDGLPYVSLGQECHRAVDMPPWPGGIRQPGL
jgi:ParB-like chromosome segregation protein Spo0J